MLCFFAVSNATLDGETLQNNGIGLLIRTGSTVRSGGQGRPITARNNSTMDLTGSITGNGSAGVFIREASAARLAMLAAGAPPAARTPAPPAGASTDDWPRAIDFAQAEAS